MKHYTFIPDLTQILCTIIFADQLDDRREYCIEDYILTYEIDHMKARILQAMVLEAIEIKADVEKEVLSETNDQ